MAAMFDLCQANERRGDTPSHVNVTCQHVMFTAHEKCEPLRNLLYMKVNMLTVLKHMVIATDGPISQLPTLVTTFY